MGKNLFLILSASLFMTGCFKDSVHNDANTTAVVAIYHGGVSNIANAPLSLATPDSLVFYMNAGIASQYTANRDVVLSINVNDAARIAYNESHDIQYEALPDSLYKFTDDSITLTAGTRSVNFPILIYSGKADLTKNYMLPVAIKDAQGLNISADSGVIYLSQIGSPIAGRYTVSGTRTNYVGPISAGIVETVTDLSTMATKTTATQSFTNVTIDYADLGIAGWQYEITYNPVGKTVSIAPNDIIMGAGTGVLEGSFIVDIQAYDPVTKVLHFKTEYTNQAGNARVIDEYLTPQ